MIIHPDDFSFKKNTLIFGIIRIEKQPFLLFLKRYNLENLEHRKSFDQLIQSKLKSKSQSDSGVIVNEY